MSDAKLIRLDTMNHGIAYVRPYDVIGIFAGGDGTTAITVIPNGCDGHQFLVEGEVDEVAASFESNAGMKIARIC